MRVGLAPFLYTPLRDVLKAAKGAAYSVGIEPASRCNRSADVDPPTLCPLRILSPRAAPLTPAARPTTPLYHKERGVACVCTCGNTHSDTDVSVARVKTLYTHVPARCAPLRLALVAPSLRRCAEFSNLSRLCLYTPRSRCTLCRRSRGRWRWRR